MVFPDILTLQGSGGESVWGGKKEKKVWGRVIHTVGEILIIEHNGGCHSGNVIRRLSAAAVLTAV